MAAIAAVAAAATGLLPLLHARSMTDTTHSCRCNSDGCASRWFRVYPERLDTLAYSTPVRTVQTLPSVLRVAPQTCVFMFQDAGRASNSAVDAEGQKN
jgi:hypothetical protein